MFYGYDVKNDSTELVIASEVFTNALSPSTSDANNEATNIIGKIMLMSQAAVVKQTAKKTWTDMAARGGIPLLLAQMKKVLEYADIFYQKRFIVEKESRIYNLIGE